MKCKVCQIKRKEATRFYGKKVKIKHHNTFNMVMFFMNNCSYRYRVNRGLEGVKKQIKKKEESITNIQQKIMKANKKHKKLLQKQLDKTRNKKTRLKKLKNKLINTRRLMKKADGHQICNACRNKFKDILNEVDYKVLGISNEKYKKKHKDPYLINFKL